MVPKQLQSSHAAHVCWTYTQGYQCSQLQLPVLLCSLQCCVPMKQAEADANAAQLADLQRQLESTRAELAAAAAAANDAATMAAERIQQLQVQQELLWLATACSVERTVKKLYILLDLSLFKFRRA